MDNHAAVSPPNSSARLERLPISRLHKRLLVVHGFGWLFDAMDVGIVTFVIAALAADWHLSSGQLGLIGSASLAGMFVGALFSGYVADVLGRKKVFQITLLIFSITTLLCAIAWDVPSMILFRFLVGVGLGGELPVVSSLMSEFVPSAYRGKYVVLLESFWAYGWLLAAIVAFVIIPEFGWRIAFVVGALPAFYIWVIRRKLPESPRWLESTGKYREANEVLADLEAESERITGTKLSPVNADVTMDAPSSVRVSYLEHWSKPFRKRTLMLWILWFGLVFGYYGIFVWLPTLLVRSGFTMVNSFSYVVIITVAQIPGYFSAGYLVERIGRKPVIALYLFMTAVCAVAFGESTEVWMILLSASAMSFFNLGAWGAVYTYTPEQYPTRIRASGAGAAAACGRVGGVIAPIMVGYLLPTIGREGIMVMNSCLFVIASIAVLIMGAETKGKTLEEIAG